MFFFWLFSWAQQRHLSILNTSDKAPIIYQTKAIQTSAIVDSADIIWYEDFREGLDGNNSSTNPEDGQPKVAMTMCGNTTQMDLMETIQVILLLNQNQQPTVG